MVAQYCFQQQGVGSKLAKDDVAANLGAIQKRCSSALVPCSERGQVHQSQWFGSLKNKFKPEDIAPGHYTGEPTFAALRQAFGDRYPMLVSALRSHREQASAVANEEGASAR